MMEDNNKLFVFDKKEVVLIFVFLVVIAITAFTLGVRIGKQLSLKEDGYTRTDVESLNENVDLKSVDEEYVDSLAGEGEAPNTFEGALRNQEAPTGKPASAETNSETSEDVEARLREEMEKLAAGDLGAEEGSAEEAAPPQESVRPESTDSEEEEIESADDLYRSGADVQGKFTIQLYANQSKAAAQDFADAFIVKGYDVIINEAQIPGKGTWYRVSIGAFDTVGQAKDYLRKEQSLFQGEDYIIQQL